MKLLIVNLASGTSREEELAEELRPWGNRGLCAHIVGSEVPLQTEGPLRGITVDLDTMVREYCQAMDWDPVTCKPSRGRLAELDLEDIAAKL